MPELTAPLIRSALRQAVTASTRPPEPELLPGLVDQARLGAEQAAAAQTLALRIARGVRERTRDGGRAGLVQGLLQEFALSSQEGVALMCLAEALLRIPDTPTRDALIRDKLAHGNWQQHLGNSPSLFVNAAAWGLLLTGRLVSTHSDTGSRLSLERALARGGAPLIRKGVDMALRLMGEQFVTGQTIEQALARAQPRELLGFRYSFDMLGEAALTDDDALRYWAAYEAAIHAIGHASAGRGPIGGPGISIKLSALHPRYLRAQVERVMGDLLPRLLHLGELARRYDIGMNIDAEESDRLELSLDLLEHLCFAPGLAGWQGIGFVVQAYQKRCPAVIDTVIDLARRSGHRIMVRLVKGAYWDSEIKRAQQDGLGGYPVYTRKPYTDVAYLACARRLLDAPDAVYPQFATHNAQTLAAVHEMAGPLAEPGRYEFQCLHGMGEPLYEQVVSPRSEGGLGRPCRVYAPVGTHDTLLAYLVRRLLENGANSSFVNQIADDSVSLESLAADPVAWVQAAGSREGAVGLPHPSIPLPGQLYGAARLNSSGLDLSDERTLAALGDAFAADAAREHVASATALREARGPAPAAGGPAEDVNGSLREGVASTNPADRSDRVGMAWLASPADVESALCTAAQAAPLWAAVPPAERARCLDAAADAMQADMLSWVPLLVREAGKTCANAVAEVREAVDFLRDDAAQLRRGFDPATHRPLGVVACISPWNFPLAIFVGQVAAALAAGNAVLAKPAEQTPLVAARAVRWLHAAGVPAAALQLLPGPGHTVGAALVADARVNGVLFTGSTEVARLLQRTLARRLNPDGRPVPLVAETGGQNAMIVDSSALAEQAVADALHSAFDSAGQRCSALRVLCVQDEVAPRVLALLQGALEQWRVGDPRELATDVGPVIDDEAREGIERHVQQMKQAGYRVWRLSLDAQRTAKGCFVAPTVIEIDRIAALTREVFGPVLHVLRYRREQLGEVLRDLRATGYGLTQGVHTRIDETVAQVAQASTAGNLYVNRNIVGAVVGVQPFGGDGLSGTGPKAGGPLYLLRLLAERPWQAARVAVAHVGPVCAPPIEGLAVGWPGDAGQALSALRAWALQQGSPLLAAHCDAAVAESPVGHWHAAGGPTGELNLYRVLPRERVLCLVSTESRADRLAQLAAVLAVGAQAVWPASALSLREQLPVPVRERISLAQDWRSPHVAFDAVVQHGTSDELLDTAQVLAARPGPVIGLIGLQPGDGRVPVERLVIERSLSLNTAAAGGNASLMTLD